MEGRRWGDMIGGEKNCGCCRGEGALIRERGEKERERESVNRVQGSAQEKHLPKPLTGK